MSATEASFYIHGVCADFPEHLSKWVETHLPGWRVEPDATAAGSATISGPADQSEKASQALERDGHELPGFDSAYRLGTKAAFDGTIKGPARDIHAPGAVVPLAALPTAEQVLTWRRRHGQA